MFERYFRQGRLISAEFRGTESKLQRDAANVRYERADNRYIELCRRMLMHKQK